VGFKYAAIFLAGLLTPFAAGLAFLLAGGMPVATKGPPLPLERWVAHKAIRAAIGADRGLRSPLEASDSNLVAGARAYAGNCAVCHGVPGGAPNSIAKGLFPRPPQLFEKDDSVADDPIGTIFWKVKNGIRLTGMPGFVGELSDDDIWRVSLLLAQAEKLPESAKQALATDKR
jgi:mono/diheme cytochrome c family protein